MIKQIFILFFIISIVIFIGGGNDFYKKDIITIFNDFIINTINGLKNIFNFIKYIGKNNFISLLSISLFIILIPLILYFYIYNPYNLKDRYITISIVITFTIMVLLYSIYSIFNTFNSNYDNNINSEFVNFKNVFYKIALLFGSGIFIFFILQLFLNISYYWLLIDIKNKIILTFVILVFMGLFYNNILKLILENDNLPSFIGLVIEIIFYIPCLFIEILNYLITQYTSMGNPTKLLLGISLIIVIFYYLIPFLLTIIKNKKEINLLENNKPASLDNYENNKKNNLVYLNKKDINSIRFKLKTPIQRKLLIENKKIKDYLDYYNKNEDNKYLESDLSYNNDIVYENNNIIFTLGDIISTYLSNKFSDFKEYFKLDFDFNLIKYYDDYFYGLEYNSYNKYNPVNYGKYNSRSPPTNTEQSSMLIHNRGSAIINNKNKLEYKEGFNTEHHILDKKVDVYNTIKNLSQEEKYLLQDVINDDIDVFLKRFNYEDSDINSYLSKQLKSDKNINKIFNKIKLYNKQKNEYIYSTGNAVVELINYYNNIKDIYYHYGLSFWIYFDTSVLNNQYADYSDSENIGLILNYSNNPIIKYDYNTNELLITIEECLHDKLNDRYNCKEVVIYRTSDIIFQKWNLFVVNYDYGILDIFINNNLVLTKNLSPFIKNNKLIIGDKDYPLVNSGICNIKYKEKPYSNGEIKRIYSNKNNPCI